MIRSFLCNRLGSRLALWSVLVVGSIGASLVLPGCNHDSTSSDGGAPSARLDEAAETQLSDEECEDLLDRAWTTAQPERMQVTAEPEVTVRTLNNWLRGCVPARPKESQAERPLPIELPATAREALAADRFTVRDVLHLRNAILHERTTRFAAPSDSDLGRAVDLFYYVVDNVALQGDGDAALPLTPFEILLFGRGTAEDRAWVFAELLRQLHLDAVILRPKAGNEQAWLVGVPIQGQVYLFDTRLGWPIPAAEATEAVRVRQPATLAEVTGNDDLLRRLDVEGQPYPLSADALKAVRVELIGYGSVWSPLLRTLQAHLAGDRSVIVYEPLADGPMQQGLVSRLAAVGKDHWSRDDIGVWSYPESRWQAAEHRDAEQENRRQSLWEPMTAPRPIKDFSLDAQGMLAGLAFGNPERVQLKTRIEQLLGDYRAAIRSYMSIRMADRVPPLSQSAAKDLRIPEFVRPQIPAHVPEPVRRLHADAADDAYFWTGLCKQMQGDYAAAAGTFAEYLRAYPEGRWTVPARGLLALMQAERHQFAEAAATLDDLPSDIPQAAGLLLLRARWKAMADGAP